MKNSKSRFVFNRSQQNGIFVLVLIIVILQLIYFFYPFSSEVSESAAQEELVEKLQRSVDSLKAVSAGEPRQLAPFNPNFISDYKGYQLGMSVEEIDRLHAYREQELWVNSAEEFQKVTGVSDSLLKELSIHFKFPEWKQNPVQNQRSPKKRFSGPLKKQDLNTATAEELRVVNGVGEKLSERILKYRHSLGGFRGIIQLKDVYGLTPEVVERISLHFQVDEGEFQKLNINSAGVLELSELPYIDYEIARAIIDRRKKTGNFASLEELTEIRGFPGEKIDRIGLYLATD